MHKPIKISYVIFICQHFLLIAIYSCTQNVPISHELAKKDSVKKPPDTITDKPPVVTLLDTCPPPKTIRLLPPEKKSASFFVSMQNFTTKNGLTNNRVQKGCIDKNGNLRFGTYGGGVSC